MIENRQITCPYCNALFETQIDCSAGAQQYTEDCHICCQPILFNIEVGPQFQLTSVTVRNENE
jgi:transcription elongation factor Elf1